MFTLLADPLHSALTFSLAGLMAYFLMKVGFQDSFYVAGIAAVSSIMASISTGLLVDLVLSPPHSQPSSPEQSTSYRE
jgi:hypothetical protein